MQSHLDAKEAKQNIRLDLILDRELADSYIGSYDLIINVLGKDPHSKKEFKTSSFTQKVLPCKPNSTQIEQLGLDDCQLRGILKAIVRRFPDLIEKLITEVPNTPYVAVKLFQTIRAGEDMLFVPCIYYLEKSHIEPANNSARREMQLTPKDYLNPWVSILEKALVMLFVKTDIRAFEHIYSPESKETHSSSSMAYFSYSDLVIIPTYYLYRALLGCRYQATHARLSTELPIVDSLTNFLLQNEIVTTSFYENTLNIEPDHMYELVDLITGKKGTPYEEKQFVILSNPWKYSGVSPRFNIKDLEYFEGIISYPNASLQSDPSVFMLSIDEFKRNVNGIYATKQSKTSIAMLSSIQSDLASHDAISDDFHSFLNSVKTLAKVYTDRPYSYWRHSYWVHAKFIYHQVAKIEIALVNKYITQAEGTYMLNYFIQFILQILDGKSTSLNSEFKTLQQKIAKFNPIKNLPETLSELSFQTHMKFLKECYLFKKDNSWFTKTSTASATLTKYEFSLDIYFNATLKYFSNPDNSGRSLHNLIANYFPKDLFKKNSSSPGLMKN